ncbi:SSI family serine proteinase inhibitor [Streptomyces sp. NPDC018693]|uniref:SSI family serine proteinase inhibitor n=1 Tax=unclassified Streptomyces TaxID=2593676 RepID=UPI0037975670
MTYTTYRLTHAVTRTALRRALPATAALLLAAAPAHATATATATAEGTAEGTRPGTWLRLSVTQGTPQSSYTRRTLLLCDPPQGHSRADEACAQLDVARGDIRALPHADAICAFLYAPVTARAEGRWHGRPVRYKETFANPCEMGAHTGAVFALDE